MLKWHGGKSYLADWIISHFLNEYLHYVEPYFGGGSVLLANDPNGISEVVNDLNGDLINFWNVLRTNVDELKRMCEATPFCETTWQKCASQDGTDVERAWAFFVYCRQSMSGRMKTFTPLSKNRVRRGMNEQASAWLSAIEELPQVHERLKRVVILNRPAIEVIRQQDGLKTLFYLDPPYLHSTRSTKNEYGDNEMSEQDHIELLDTLAGIKGKFVLSGYPSELYGEYAEKYSWNTDTKLIDNKSSKSETKELKHETLWMNF